MDWQASVALLIVACTGLLLLRSRFGRRKYHFQEQTGCGCSSAASSVPQGKIVFHARKGERPEVIVHMK
jgi:hypothetical protein